MQISELIHRLKAEKIDLEIAENDRLKVVGEKAKIAQFSPLLKEHKQAILEVLKQGVNYPFLDDRHSCLECSNLTPSNSCRQVVRGGKFVAWIDSQWLDKKHRCERFKVKAVRH